MANATTEFIWIKSLLQELQIPLQRSPILWCDNIGATYLAANPVFHARTKHIKIDYHFVWEHVKLKNLRIGYLATKDQTADILTKALPKHRFLSLMSKLHLLPTLDCGGMSKHTFHPVQTANWFTRQNGSWRLSDSRNSCNNCQLSLSTWTNRRMTAQASSRLIKRIISS